MAYIKYSVSSDEWTLVANNKNTISIFNIGSYVAYLAFTATNVAPTETIGMPLDIFPSGSGGLIKQSTTNLTTVATPNYVWARSAGGQGTTIIIETN